MQERGLSPFLHAARTTPPRRGRLRTSETEGARDRRTGARAPTRRARPRRAAAHHPRPPRVALHRRQLHAPEARPASPTRSPTSLTKPAASRTTSAAAGRPATPARATSSSAARRRGSPRGLRPQHHRQLRDRRSHASRRLLRRPYAAAARPSRHPDPQRARPRPAALPRPRRDDRRRPRVLLARLARSQDQGARRPQAQHAAAPLLRRPGLPHRVGQPPGGRRRGRR